MFPPISRQANGHLEMPSQAVLDDVSGWEIWAVSDSEAGCQKARLGIHDAAATWLHDHFGVSDDMSGIETAREHTKDLDKLDQIKIASLRLDSKCISADDPQLKR
jgi:hypothetical protein